MIARQLCSTSMYFPYKMNCTILLMVVRAGFIPAGMVSLI